MLKSWLGWINLALAATAVVVLVAAAGVFFVRESHIPSFEGPVQERRLPKSSFSLDKSYYDAIDSGPLKLQFAPQTMQLPDLRKSLIYYGKNNRPDAQLQTPLLHFAFTGNPVPTSIPPDQHVYIKYDRKKTPPQYVFSPGNKETALWLEVSPQEDQALVKVGMVDDKGTPIAEPEANAYFKLKEKTFTRTGGGKNNWEIGKLRVDGTLLARQKARWYGVDKFLEKHGGPEYAHIAGKQRIDFGEGDNAYSIYVGPEDVVVWDGSRWKTMSPGEETLGFPLMAVKKIDDRLMTFELWDVEGKNKVTLNLLKSTEAWVPQNLQQSFKFLGARTRSQFVFDVNKERIMLSPQDWLLLTDNGWKKLTIPEEIDAYVDRKMTGPLFVFDSIEKHEDKQFLKGTLFNATRSAAQEVEIPMQKEGKEMKKEAAPARTLPKPSIEAKSNKVEERLPSEELMRRQTLEEHPT